MPADGSKEINAHEQAANFDLLKGVMEKDEIPAEQRAAFDTVKAAVDFFDSGAGYELDIEKQADREKWESFMKPIDHLFGIHMRSDAMNIVRTWKKAHEAKAEV